MSTRGQRQSARRPEVAPDWDTTRIQRVDRRMQSNEA